MSYRVTEYQTLSNVLKHAQAQRNNIDTLTGQISSGIKAALPGDSNQTGAISQFRQQLDRLDGYKTRIASVESELVFRDDGLKDAQELIIRAKELATQGANEPNGSEGRAKMAAEVWQLREHLLTLANAKYQGKYIYNGTADATAPFQPTTYTNGGSADSLERYQFNPTNLAGANDERTIRLSDDLTVDISSDGGSLFSNAIYGLERLGRALEGYRTTVVADVPTGAGTAFTFPADLAEQTADIRTALDLFNTAGDSIQVSRVTLGSQLRTIDTANGLMQLNRTSALQALEQIQDTDTVEAAAQLAQAQTSLQASLTISSKVLNLSILDYL